MNERADKCRVLCREAIERVDVAITNHQNGVEDDLSIGLLVTVREELQKMETSLSPKIFSPGYGRFIADWPDNHGLVKQLSEIDYQYSRLK